MERPSNNWTKAINHMLFALLFRTLRSANKRCSAEFHWEFPVIGALFQARPLDAEPLPTARGCDTLSA
jgi:hypothetical protein